MALAVAETLRGAACERVIFVSLASARDADSVLAAIAVALGVPGGTHRALVASLAEALAGGSHLLVLDGFDRVVPVGPDLAALAARCPGLKVLVTSREVLQVYGEHMVTVTPLGVPSPSDVAAGREPDVGAWLRRFPALDLFVERARATRHDFAVTVDDLPSIATICARLD